MIGAFVALSVAASTAPPKPVDNDIDTESAKSGPIGLAVIIILCVVCYFLFKSLSKHLRRIRDGAVPMTSASVARARPVIDVAAPLDPGVREEPAPKAPTAPNAPPPT